MQNKHVITRRKKPTVHVVPNKVVEPMAEVTTQPIKPARVPLRYPCIIFSSSKHRAFDCPKKEKIQNMFQIKPTTTTIVIVKNLKLNNVPFNVVNVVTTCSQVQEQHVFKKHEPMKAKTIVN